MVPGVYKNLPMEAYSRACFKETSLHISIAKVLHSLHSNFLTTFLQKKFYLSSQISDWPFGHCTNSLSSLHISIHHFTFCA